MWKNRKRLPAQVWDGLEGFVDECAQMITPAFRTWQIVAGPSLLSTGSTACIWLRLTSKCTLGVH